MPSDDRLGAVGVNPQRTGKIGPNLEGGRHLPAPPLLAGFTYPFSGGLNAGAGVHPLMAAGALVAVELGATAPGPALSPALATWAEAIGYGVDLLGDIICRGISRNSLLCLGSRAITLYRCLANCYTLRHKANGGLFVTRLIHFSNSKTSQLWREKTFSVVRKWVEF